MWMRRPMESSSNNRRVDVGERKGEVTNASMVLALVGVKKEEKSGAREGRRNRGRRMCEGKRGEDERGGPQHEEGQS